VADSAAEAGLLFDFGSTAYTGTDSPTKPRSNHGEGVTVYSHVRIYDERRAVEDLPDVDADNTGEEEDRRAASA